MSNKEDCPAIDSPCEYYTYIRDNFEDIVLEHCTHLNNLDPDHEGNCKPSLCPLATVDFTDTLDYLTRDE